LELPRLREGHEKFGSLIVLLRPVESAADSGHAASRKAFCGLSPSRTA